MWFKKSQPPSLEGRIVDLDVREDLRNKLEPFEKIMNAVKQLNKEDTFVLHATFKPTPLLGVMKVKGFVHQIEQKAADHWIVTFVHKSREDLLNTETASDAAADHTECNAASEINEEAGEHLHLDNRGLEPPQPMVRTLSKLSHMQPGDKLTIHNDRVPAFLIEELNNLGYPFDVEEQEDGSAKVTIHKK
jgi:TusA-related sulfurtransferase